MKNAARTALLLAVAGALIVACAAPTAPTPTSPQPAATIAAATVSSAPNPESSDELGLCRLFTEDLAIAALGGGVSPPASGDMVPEEGPEGVFCRYASVVDAGTTVEAISNTRSRADCEGDARFLGMRPIGGLGELAYENGRPGQYDAYVIGWASGICVTVRIESDREQNALLLAAKTIAAHVLP